jgi:hypothetical protein
VYAAPVSATLGLERIEPTMTESYKKYLASLTYEKFVAFTFEGLVDSKIGKVIRDVSLKGKRTGHHHQIDILIELSIAGIKLMVLVECKHYKSKVRIDDILAFAQRIDDIGAHKGVLVTTVGFQKGAAKVADAHRIALVTTEPIWQVRMYEMDSTGKPLGWVDGEIYIGGPCRGRFCGVTMRALNVDVRKFPPELAKVEAQPSTVWLLLRDWMAANAQTVRGLQRGET